MSIDFLRELRTIGHDLTSVRDTDVRKRGVSPRSCLIFICPSSKLDPNPYSDAYLFANMAVSADFSVNFVVQPDYSQFCDWMELFLVHATDYLLVLFTGFPVGIPNETTQEGRPLPLTDRDVKPSRLFSIIRKKKAQSSRLTLFISGAPTAETWSGGENDTLGFSATATMNRKNGTSSFSNQLPEKVLFFTIVPRLDTPTVSPRDKDNNSRLLTKLKEKTDADPTLPAGEIIQAIQPQLRDFGLELVTFSSSNDVVAEIPMFF